MARSCWLLCVLLAAVACSGPAPPQEAASPSVEAGASVGEVETADSAPEMATAKSSARLARLPESAEGDAAAVEGVLREADGCLYLEAAGPTRYLIASAVPGLRWEGGEEALVVGAEAYPLGSRVGLGGSEAPASNLDGLWVEPPGSACDASKLWIAHSITPAD